MDVLGAVKNYLSGLLDILLVLASSKNIKTKKSDNGVRNVSLHKIKYRPKKWPQNPPKIPIFGPYLILWRLTLRAPLSDIFDFMVFELA